MTFRCDSFGRLAGVLALCMAPNLQADDLVEVVVVTSRLRETPVDALPASVTLLQRGTVADAGLQHFADLLPLVPNLNWSAGTARPRYFQLRGIGELDQYQGAPNPSVGFLIDDIDFSGVGMPATTFDVEQIETVTQHDHSRHNCWLGIFGSCPIERPGPSTYRCILPEVDTPTEPMIWAQQSADVPCKPGKDVQ